MNTRVANHLGAMCIASALVAVVAPLSASATTRPRILSPRVATGNPATIAFYRKVVQATRSVDAFRMSFGVVDTMLAVKYEGGGRYSWVQDYPKLAGYEPAEGAIWVGQAGGRVQFVAETVVAGRGSGAGASFPSFGLVLTPKGEIILSGGADPSSVSGGYQPCSGTTTGSPYVGGYTKTGVPGGGYGLYGHFLPMKRSGNTVIVTSTFPWGTHGQKATEIDRISATTYLPSRTIIHVSAGRGGAAYASFTIAYTNSWYHTPISPPKSTGICASYLKSIH